METEKIMGTISDLETLYEPMALAIFDQGAKAMYCSMVTSTPDAKARLLKAISAPDFRAADIVGKKLVMVMDIIAHNVQLVSEQTGEITDANRVILVTPSGQTVATVSAGVVSGLSRIMSLFGKAPWNPPLPLYIEQTNTRKGNRIYNILVAEDAAAKKWPADHVIK